MIYTVLVALFIRFWGVLLFLLFGFAFFQILFRFDEVYCEGFEFLVGSGLRLHTLLCTVMPISGEPNKI